MSYSHQVSQSAVVAPPVTITATAVTASSTSAVSISTARGKWITVCATGTNCYIRFGASSVGAADADQWPVPQNTKDTFFVPSTVTHFRVIGEGTGKLHWYVSSDV